MGQWVARLVAIMVPAFAAKLVDGLDAEEASDMVKMIKNLSDEGIPSIPGKTWQEVALQIVQNITLGSSTSIFRNVPGTAAWMLRIDSDLSSLYCPSHVANIAHILAAMPSHEAADVLDFMTDVEISRFLIYMDRQIADDLLALISHRAWEERHDEPRIRIEHWMVHLVLGVDFDDANYDWTTLRSRIWSTISERRQQSLPVVHAGVRSELPQPIVQEPQKRPRLARLGR